MEFEVQTVVVKATSDPLRDQAELGWIELFGILQVSDQSAPDELRQIFLSPRVQAAGLFTKTFIQRH